MSKESSHAASYPRGPKIVYRLFVVVYFLLLGSAIGYLWTFAENRYSTTASFKISRQDTSNGSSAMAAMAIPGLTESGSADSQIAMGFVDSADFLIGLEQECGLEDHFTSPKKDWFFRLDRGAPLEERLDYYRKQIGAEYDSVTGLTILTVQTYDPALSHKVASLALKKAEKFINRLNQSIADQRLEFIRSEYDRAVNRVQEQNRNVIEFQNKHNLINPEEAINQNLSAVQSLRMDRLRAEAELRTLMKDSPQSPLIDEINSHLASLDQLIAKETEKLSGAERGRLNQLLVEYQVLRQQLEFALQMQSGAQVMLEKTRLDAVATSRFFSVIQWPYLPEDVSAPRRTYASTTIFVLGMLMFLILRGLARSAMERF
jgi:capsular polysaccharide transport system permease protein